MVNSPNRFGLIDNFRAIAILSVMVFHFTVALAPPFINNDVYKYGFAFPTFMEVGRYGVHLFFIISGLVISMTLIRSANAVDFAWKRFARIYPAYFVAATLAFISTFATGAVVGGGHLADYLTTLALASPILHRHWVDEVYWTLLVEAKFYVLVGLAFVILRRRFWMGVVAYAFLTAALSLKARWGAHEWLIADSMPFFLAGMGTWFGAFEKRRVAAMVCLGSALILYAVYNVILHQSCNELDSVCMAFDSNLIAHGFVLGFGGLMITLLFMGVRSGFGPLAWVGRISYSLYLVHDVVGVNAIRAVIQHGGPAWLAITVALAASTAIGMAMFYYVEEPTHQRLKLAFGRSDQQSATQINQPVNCSKLTL